MKKLLSLVGLFSKPSVAKPLVEEPVSSTNYDEEFQLGMGIPSVCHKSLFETRTAIVKWRSDAQPQDVEQVEENIKMFAEISAKACASEAVVKTIVVPDVFPPEVGSNGPAKLEYIRQEQERIYNAAMFYMTT